MSIKKWFVGISTLCALALGGTAKADVFDYTFTVSGNWYDAGGNPYGMPNSPTLTGTVEFDNSFSGFASFRGFALTTGTKTWTTADVTGDSTGAAFDGLGNLAYFNVNFADASGNGYIDSNNTFAVTERITIESNLFNFCNDCVSFNEGVPASPVPEPETYAMMLAGLGLLGFAARRRKLKEASAV